MVIKRLLEDFNELFEKVINKKKAFHIELSEDKINAYVLFYFLLNFKKYCKNAIKYDYDDGNEIYPKDRIDLFLIHFTDKFIYKKNIYIQNVCSYQKLNKKIQDVILFDTGISKDDEFLDFLDKVIDGDLFNIIDVTNQEYFSETEIYITICKKYSQNIHTPTNLDIDFWDFRKAVSYKVFMERDYINKSINTDLKKEFPLSGNYFDRNQENLMQEALCLYYFIKNTASSSYNILNMDLYLKRESKGLYYMSNDYFEKRREFLSDFFEDDNPYIRIIAYSFALPFMVFRNLLDSQNIDLQDIESFLRRINSREAEYLRMGYEGIFYSNPIIDLTLDRGWKTIWHKPTLEEFLDEETFEETERFSQRWAIQDLWGLGMGFTVYHGSINDKQYFDDSYFDKLKEKTADVYEKILVNKNTEENNVQEEVYNKYHIEHNGTYGISTRKIFGNYLWGNFEEEKVHGWVCPRV